MSTAVLRILIVDDSGVVRAKLRRDLGRGDDGWNVIEAEDLAAARSVIEERPPDLLLLDLHLPDGKGTDLLVEMRSENATRGVPVLMITGSEGTKAIEDCFETGADDFLRKPWEPVELVARARGLLRRRVAEVEMERLQTIFDQSQQMARIGGWELDLETNSLTWTDEVYRIIELPFDHVPEVESTLEYYPSAMRPRIRKMLLQAMETGETFRFESPFTTARGRDIWVATIIRVAFRGNTAVKLWGTFQDLTEAHSATEALRESETRYRMLAANATDMISQHDPQGIYLYVSPNCETILGYAPEEMLGRSAYDFFHPDDLEAIRESHDTIRTVGAVGSATYRILRKDGGYAWFETTSRMSGGDGRDNGENRAHPVRIYAISRDVTARKRIEEERDRIFTLSRDMLCVAGLDGYFKQVNPAWTQMLGWSEEELLAKPWLEFVHPDDQANTVAAGDRLLRGEPILGFENRYLHKNGSVHWLSWNSEPLVEKNIIIAVVRDVTEHKAYQERLAYDATHDILTGLYNRRYLLDELEHQFAFARRYESPLSFCLCDLDHFKAVNDTHGHQTGDVVLARFAEFLKGTIRDSDLAGRYGGEEFALIFANTHAAEAADCAGRVLARLRQEAFTSASGETFSVSATFGVSEFDPSLTGPADLIARADRALYAGKARGRARVVGWSELADDEQQA